MASPAAVLRGMLGLGLLSRVEADWLFASALGIAGPWLGGEAILVPPLLERIRQLPARFARVPPSFA